MQPQPYPKRVQEVLISAIIPKGVNIRTLFDDDHVVELAQSIAAHGLLQPIGVKKDGEGKYLLIWGKHRLAAAMRLKWERIPAVVHDEHETEARAKSLIENVVRKDLTLTEEVEAVHHLNSKEGKSASQICAILGKSRAWVDRRLMVPNLPPDMVAPLLDGHITLGAAEEIALLESSAQREWAMNQAWSCRMTTREVKNMVETMRSTNMEEAIQAAQQAVTTDPMKPKEYLYPCEICGGEFLPTEITAIRMCKKDAMALYTSVDRALENEGRDPLHEKTN